MRIQSSVLCAIRALGPLDRLPFLNLLLALRHELAHVGIHAFRPHVLPHDGRVAWMYRSKPSTELRNFTRCCIRYPCRIFIRDHPLPPPPLPAVSQGCKPSRRPSSACGRLLVRVRRHEASVDILRLAVTEGL